MKKIVQIVGPTASGKTALSVEIANRFNGSLISADSVQVYRHLDIISGKDIPVGSKFHFIKKITDRFDLGFYEFDDVKIYLLDVIDPLFSFSVFDFIKVSEEAVRIIQKEGKLPILVGGTGLYAQKFSSGLDTYSSNLDLELRKKLSEKAVLELQKELENINPVKFNNMNNSDVNNSRRLIRAIEIEKSKDYESKIKNVEKNVKSERDFSNLVIGLKCEREVLKKRIDDRVDKRLENGAVEEAKSLFKNYKKLSSNVKTANGYKQMFGYLQKEIDFDEAIDRWKISEYRLAKNQMTWFQKYGKTKWFDIKKKGFKRSIEQEIASFIS